MNRISRRIPLAALVTLVAALAAADARADGFVNPIEIVGERDAIEQLRSIGNTGSVRGTPVRIEAVDTEGGTVYVRPLDTSAMSGGEDPCWGNPDCRPDGFEENHESDDDSYTPPIHLLPLVAIKLDYPTVVAGSFGVIIGNRSISPDSFEGAEGLLIAVEPGLKGGKLHVGYVLGAFASVDGDFGIPVGIPLLAVAFKASLLRTWNRDRDLANNETYVGAEVEFALFALSLSVGLYGRVAGDDPEADSIRGTASFGIGF